jgi:ubiquinone/menaquinone biosynthesis C-methylase UbiE
MKTSKPDDNFYDKIKPRLYHRAGRELRLAHRVLDLGCGDCELTRYLSDTNGQETIGVDVSSVGFPDDLPTSGRHRRTECIAEDAERLDSIEAEAVDAIVMFWSFHEMKDPQAVLQQACRVLRTAGKILVVEFPRGSLAQKLWNENYYSSEELRSLLRQHGFKDIRVRQTARGQILWVTALRGNNCPENELRTSIRTYGKPKGSSAPQYSTKST